MLETKTPDTKTDPRLQRKTPSLLESTVASEEGVFIGVFTKLVDPSTEWVHLYVRIPEYDMKGVLLNAYGHFNRHIPGWKIESTFNRLIGYIMSEPLSTSGSPQIKMAIYSDQKEKQIFYDVVREFR